MTDHKKTKVQLLHELEAARARIRELEQQLQNANTAFADISETPAVPHERTPALLNDLQQFNWLFQNMLDGFILTDAQGNLIEVNPAYCRCVGYSRQELLGMNIRQLETEREAAEIDRIIQQILTEGRARFETRHRHKNGQLVDLAVSVVTVKSDGQTYLAGFVHDITELRSAYRELQLQTTLLKSQCEASRDGILLVDQHQQWLLWNENFLKLWNLPSDPSNIVQKDAIEHFLKPALHENDAFLEQFEQLNQDTQNDFEGTIQLKDGRYFDAYSRPIVFDEGHFGGRVWYFRDVTEKVEAETRLRTSEEMFSRIFHASPFPITLTTIDLEEGKGRFVRINEAAESYIGAEEEKVIGKTWEEIGFQYSEDVRQEILSVLSKEGRIQKKEVHVVSPDGQPRSVLFSSEILEFSGQLYLLSVIIDITEKMQSEQALRDAEAKFRSLVEQSLVGIYIIGPERFEYVNPRFAEIFGYTVDELMQSKGVLDIVYEDDRPMVANNIRRRIRGEIHGIHYTFRGVRKDGQMIYIEAHGVRSEYQGKPVIIGTLLDITDRKKADEKLRESEARLREAQRIARIGHWEMDVATLQLKWSEEIARIHDLPDGELSLTTQKALMDFVHPEDRASVQKHMQKVLSGEGFRPIEFRIRTVKGTEKIISLQGKVIRDTQQKPVRVVGTLQDVTVLKLTELALQEKSQFYEAVIEKAAEGICVFEVDPGSSGIQFIVWNRRLAEITGYDAEEVQNGDWFLRLFPGPEWHPVVLERLLRLRGGEELMNEEWQIKRKDGDLRTVSISTSVLHTQKGRQFLAMIHDKTEEKRARHELERLNAELEQRVQERTAQLQALNRELEAFSYSVSHDLKSPLRAIDGFSQALLEDYLDRLDETGRMYLKRMRAACIRMGSLIEDLLRLSRITRADLTLRTVDLSRIVRHIERDLRRTDPKRQVHFEIAEGAVAIGDEQLLRIALENLVGNSWKFTRKKKRARIEFGYRQENGETVFYVKDNGAGFDMRYVHKLFGAFQRLHSPNEFEGSGVGLATVQRIIHRHGGRIWAEGKPGKGATFYFTIKGEKSQWLKTN